MSILKEILNIRYYQQYIKPYIQRIKQDGGVWKNETNTQLFYKMCKDYNIVDSIKFAWLGEAGGKFRDSGANRFWTKGYTLKPDRSTERRNLLTYTEEFDNAVWSKTRSSITASAINNPFGVLSADKLIEDTTVSDNHYLSTPVTTSAVTTTFSCYVKAAERNWVWISMRDSGNNSRIGYYNLSTGVVGTAGSGLTISISSVGNGWYRCIATIATAYAGSFPVVVGIATDNNSQVYTGDGTSGIYIWGAQLEVGSSPSAYQRVTDANSWDGVLNDATQTTSTSQPYITGNIAPTERIGLKNPNGGSNYMTHPTISFAANEAWSVTTVVNWNGSSSGDDMIYGKSSTASFLALRRAGGTINEFYYGDDDGNRITSTISTLPFIGKTFVVTLSHNGTNLSLFVNGVLRYVFSSAYTSKFSLTGIFTSFNVAYSHYGSIHAHIIRAQALTPSQVAAEANFLRSLYPEIPSVTIGSQTWATSNCEMVSTPMGNLIANVTANTNTEKISNTTFDTSASWVLDSPSLSISGGSLNYDASVDIVNASIYCPGGIYAEKYYKVTANIITGTATFNIVLPNGTSIGATYKAYTTGINTYIFKCTQFTDSLRLIIRQAYLGATAFSMESFSVQEVGWSDSTNLYNAIYAATAGTVEQKTYAAVKAAAMWCYYNNDPALGAVYGKLFNDYATKLLAMDIAYYNTANPSTPWGWDIPLESDWSTLQTTVNNNAEALKKDGTVYWSSPNAGTNSSFFTAIPAGYRKEDGTFAGLNTTAIFSSKDNMDIPRVGKSIRLIKK